jgi:hypothetical protein
MRQRPNLVHICAEVFCTALPFDRVICQNPHDKPPFAPQQIENGPAVDGQLENACQNRCRIVMRAMPRSNPPSLTVRELE